MIINSSELRGAGFNLQEVIPPELESAGRLGRRTRGAVLRQLEGVGRFNTIYVVSLSFSRVLLTVFHLNQVIFTGKK